MVDVEVDAALAEAVMVVVAAVEVRFGGCFECMLFASKVFRIHFAILVLALVALKCSCVSDINETHMHRRPGWWQGWWPRRRQGRRPWRAWWPGWRAEGWSRHEGRVQGRH